MRLVRIVQIWQGREIFNQTPGQNGIWEDVHFTLEPVVTCDYLIILNWAVQPFTVRCPSNHVWAILQEPPQPPFKDLHRADPAYYRVITQDPELTGDRYIHAHGSIGWQAGRSYDELKACAPPEKPRTLSWITSRLAVHRGHRQRMDFLKRIEKQLDFDLWGRGFHPLPNKWDGLAPYRYSLAIENYSGPHYWSEKLADCFLAWSMPIYYGCTNLEEYFPSEAFVRVDITHPNAAQKVAEVIRSDLWQRNREAIAYARQLILDKYQLFPRLVQDMRAFEATQPGSQVQTIHIPATRPKPLTLWQRLPIYGQRLKMKLP